MDMSTEFEDARREFLVKALSMGAFALGSGGIALPAWSMGEIPDELEPGRSIYDMGGVVRVDGKRATEKTVISANSLVETESGSHVVFVIGGDAHILRENSRVQFSGKDFFEHGLRLVTGKLLSVFGAREPAQPAHTMQTSTATIGIRGTGVYAESEKDVSYLCTCYGVVDIVSNSDRGKSSERIAASHHDAPRYILKEGKAGQLIEPAPVKNHTDEELMLVEALVGRTTPFSSVKGYSAPRQGY
ncbi:conserved hypothetical protein [gamma proteobacterium HTCC5015]|nr:conserved hypothetical protein [gamma proteobacterium HTCC5015]